MSTGTADVIIIGAGAAGLTAAYDLSSNSSISYKILEASSILGGRLKKAPTDFVDIPIDIGGEWIHRNPTILDVIVNDGTKVSNTIPTFKYTPNIQYLEDGKWYSEPREVPNSDTGEPDHHFVGYTWYDFFADYIATDKVQSNIVYGCQVTSINYSTDPIQIQCSNGNQWMTKKVIVTTSLKVIQSNAITFTPTLPTNYANAIQNLKLLSGIKVFIRFSNDFYYDTFYIDNQYASNNERFFYDETYGRNTNEHILGVFLIGATADTYVGKTDTEITQSILSDLDTAFNGQASTNFVNSIVQNWNKEQYILGAYLDDNANSDYVDVLREPINDKLYFAGEAIPADNYQWGFVHGAALSGRRAAQRVTGTYVSKSSDCGLFGFGIFCAIISFFRSIWQAILG